MKFLRWVQWRITESSAQEPAHLGVIVFITDNSFIASPTFRGMRRFLLTQFDEIFVMNLHGRSRGGAEAQNDQNIFAIQQGVCITILVRHTAGDIEQLAVREASVSEAVSNELSFVNLIAPPEEDSVRENARMQELSTAQLRAIIRYLSSGTGSRLQKYDWLNALTWSDVATAEQIRPASPYYFFKPYEADDQYWTWLSISQIFRLGNMCITTGNDRERVSLLKSELQAGPPGRDETKMRRYSYRPFDLRWIYHDNRYLERARMDVMHHLYDENIALIVLNQTRSVEAYNYAFVTKEIADKSLISTEANCYAYPLYFYLPATDQQVLPGQQSHPRESNVSSFVLAQLSAHYEAEITGDDVFYYIYAVLNARGYQQSYEPELRIDFPHIPFSQRRQTFDELSSRGRELSLAHLQQTLADITIGFHSAGSDTIEAKRISYDVATSAIVVNEAGARFSGVNQQLWDYRVGTHQPLEQWLRARNGKRFVLDHSDNPADEVLINDYRRIIRAIAAAFPIHERINNVWHHLLQGHS